MADALFDPVLISGENTIAKQETTVSRSPTFTWRQDCLPESYLVEVLKRHEQTGRSLRIAEKYNGPNIPNGKTTAL